MKEISKYNINFKFDDRIILLGVIKYLQKDMEKNKEFYFVEVNYFYDKMKTFFCSYKLEKNLFNINISTSLILEFKYEKDKLYCLEEDEYKKELANMLNDFIKETKFNNFIEDNKKYLNKILIQNVNRLSENKYIDDLNKYYNNSKSIKVDIILDLFRSDWGEIAQIKDHNYICIVGIFDKYPNILNNNSLASFLFHEISHPYVEEKFANEIDFYTQTESLFIKINDKNQSKVYYPFYNFWLEDTIVRAITIYLLFKNNYINKNKKDKAIKQDFEFGFIYIEDIYKIISNYSFDKAIEKIKEYIFKKSKKNDI